RPTRLREKGVSQMRFRLAALFPLLMLAATCAPTGTLVPSSTPQPSGSALAAAFPVTVTDFQNHSVTVPQRPQRIVSIGPSITEFLFALGAGPRIVRVGAFCDEPAAAATRPRVYHEIDASDPTTIFTVGPGSYIHDLIEIAGGQNIAARATSAYPQLSAEEILRSDPEIIVLAAADYSAKPEQVAARTGWSVISAVRNKRIVTIAPNLINRPGPRVGEAAEAYAKLVHPELFPWCARSPSSRCSRSRSS